MRNLSFLLILALAFIFNSCNNSLKLSEIINIKATKDSIDIDYQNLSSVVFKIDQIQIREKIYAKYPDIIQKYLRRIEIKSTKESQSLKKEINNIITNNETGLIYVEISMNYEKSKSEQAKQIIKYARSLITDELVKYNIKIENE